MVWSSSPKQIHILHAYHQLLLIFFQNHRFVLRRCEDDVDEFPTGRAAVAVRERISIDHPRPRSISHRVFLHSGSGGSDLVVGQVIIVDQRYFPAQFFERDAVGFRGEDAEEKVKCPIVERVLRP